MAFLPFAADQSFLRGPPVGLSGVRASGSGWLSEPQCLCVPHPWWSCAHVTEGMRARSLAWHAGFSAAVSLERYHSIWALTCPVLRRTVHFYLTFPPIGLLSTKVTQHP